jgi:hypothetical protein
LESKIGKHLKLSNLSIPYSRFLELEQEAEGSFFATGTWDIIQRRIQQGRGRTLWDTGSKAKRKLSNI